MTGTGMMCPMFWALSRLENAMPTCNHEPRRERDLAFRLWQRGHRQRTTFLPKNTGPPELPELMAASICTASSGVHRFTYTCTSTLESGRASVRLSRHQRD